MVSITLLGLLCSLTVSYVFEARYTTKWSSTFRPHGGYVDEIVFHIYTEIETPLAMAALQTGEIDAYDEHVLNNFLVALVNDEDIEVTFTPSTKYRALTFNCARFPTNITAFRRAMAFGYDKYPYSDIIGGFSQPQDSYIPLILTEWEVESALTEHFYEADSLSGNASLENAGFKDLDGDGWREYDTNSNGIWDPEIDFDDDVYAEGGIIQLVTTEGSDPAIRVCTEMQEGLEYMGIRSEVIEMETFQIDNVFAGNHWVVCWTESVPVFNPVKVLHNRFRTGARWNRDPNNLYHFSNSTIDTILDSMVNAASIEEVKQYAREASVLLAFEQPQIVITNDVNIGAHRNDEFEGFFEAAGIGVTHGANWAVATQVHLNESLGGPYGGVFNYCLSGNVSTWNPYLQLTAYEATVFQYIYEPLWNFDPLTWDPIPGLAYDWDIEPTTTNGDILDGQKFTFYLYENETWHDREAFKAADVNHSMHMWITSPFYPPELEDIYKVEIPDDYTIEFFTNKTGYFEWADTTAFYITPKHIWKNIENVSAYSPPTAEVIGTGPYKLDAWTPGESIRLLRHENWRWDIREVPVLTTSSIPTKIITTPSTYITTSLSSTHCSSTSTHLNSPLNILPLLQILELGVIIIFVITLVIVIRRHQTKRLK
ncbi:MAG: ABC transporter substrate-binding protein [Candidatus Hodarchaeota archaeon]